MSSQFEYNIDTNNINNINNNPRRNRNIFNNNENFSINLQPFFLILERFFTQYNNILTHMRMNSQPNSLLLERELQYIKSNIDRIINLTINVTNQRNNRQNEFVRRYSNNRFRGRRDHTIGRHNNNNNSNTINPILNVSPTNNHTEVLRVPFGDGGENGFTGLIQLLNTFSSPVIIAPTQEQIENATRRIRFEEIGIPRNVICPISLERFANNQTVSQIRQCGHIFNTTELQTWFRENVRCPVCRYDIRDYRGYNASEYVAEDTSNITSVFV